MYQFLYLVEINIALLYEYNCINIVIISIAKNTFIFSLEYCTSVCKAFKY